MATAGQQFGDRGTKQVYWTTATIASPAAPSIATDIGGGSCTEITDLIVDMPGFDRSVSFENVPSMSSLTDAKVAVSAQIGDPQLVIKRLFEDDTAWDLFAEGNGGSIIICPEDGATAGHLSEVWPVTVSLRQLDNTMGQSTRFRVSLTADVPTQGALAA